MAREEADREDLLAEATALVERAELVIEGWADPIVVGFRAVGAASIYFGQVAAYHFNRQGELRRAYLDGRLYKAEGGRLVALERHRTANAVELIRDELDDERTHALLAELAEHSSRLARDMAEGRSDLIGQVPPDRDVVARIAAWLATFDGLPTIAASAHVC